MSDAGGISLPSRPAATPGLPENFQPVTWEKFETLNTKPPRPAIGDGEMYWCDGWMPIGPSNLRLLPGVGPNGLNGVLPIQTIWMGFGNIADTSYGIALLSNGGMIAFDPLTGGELVVMPGGTILNPSTIMGFSQWGSKYLIFAKDQVNGYWLWDGTNLFTAGTIGPEVTLDAAGLNYTSPPTIAFQTTGAGTGAGFSAQIQNGSVAKITVNSPGSGFQVGDLISLNFSGGGTDNQAIAGPPLVTPTAGGLETINVVNGGSQYTSRASATVSGDGVGASVSLGIQNGVITSAAIVNPGQQYTTATITVNDPGIPGSGGSSIPGGTGGVLQANISFGQVISIGVFYGGTGYVSAPTVKIIGDGAGAQGIATIDATGAVTGIELTHKGFGYTKALAIFEGGNNAANATAILMPFGISGTAVEVAFDRVWISNGSAVATFPPKDRTIFSDPNSPVSFSNGGGEFQSTDSFLRVGYHALRQTNGFLYLIGDSSLNLISGVQTTTPSGGAIGSATTTFNNINVDPQYGSPWPSSVQVFSRNIVFANTVGIFVSYGGAVTKASLALDGFYFTGPIYGRTANFSSAVAHIFGIPVYMLLLPVIDQITGQVVNKLLMWDGKRWFTSQQDRALTFIATQEINSVLTAWGTDGTDIFPLFQRPSTNFVKIARSKLFSSPAYYTTKTAMRLTGIVNTYAVDDPVTVFIDNELGLGAGNAIVTVQPAGNNVTIVNNIGQTVAITNNSAVPVSVGSSGLDVFGPYPIAQQGRMTGLTVQTSASDLALLSLNLTEQVYTTNV